MHTLEPWIEDITLQTTRARGVVAPRPVTVLVPDVATSVVWRVTGGGVSDVLVAGARTTAAYHLSKELPVCVRLRVRAGWAMPLLGIGADELVDRVVSLSELCGPSAVELGERLMRFADRPEVGVEVLGDYLMARLPRRVPERFDLVGEAAKELAAGSVQTTASRLGVSDRYLRRVFRQAVGVSPKHFARITRVRDVISQVRDSWSETAAGAGYTDQSHLIADFRSLMRVTPTAFATGRVPLSTC